MILVVSLKLGPGTGIRYWVRTVVYQDLVPGTYHIPTVPRYHTRYHITYDRMIRYDHTSCKMDVGMYEYHFLLSVHVVYLV